MVLAVCDPSQVLYAVVRAVTIDMVYNSPLLGVGNECKCYEAMDIHWWVNSPCYIILGDWVLVVLQHLLTTPHFTCTADLVCGVRSNHTPLHYSYQSVGVIGFVFNLRLYK